MIENLRKYEEDGLLYCQSHPSHPLLIWNYTPKVQYEQIWDEITMMARGLVTDVDGNIISRGFPKFFNIEENRHAPTDDFEVFEKLDGQYIGVFWFNGEIVVNSRGSFTSPYAIEARRILDEKYPNFEKLKIGEYSTFCFELIGFEQIVVSYPHPDLVLTGIFHNYSLSENHINQELKNTLDYIKLNVATKYSGLDYTNIKKFNWKNSEGFVVRFSNGDRCKIKFEDYINLHRQMTNLSTTAIWEALKEGTPISTILNDVPDELYDKIREYETKLKNKYTEIDVHSYIKSIEITKNNPSRKEIALNLQKYPYRCIIFAMLDNKDYSEMIWKMIKPKFEKI